MTLGLLESLGTGLAAPSANRFGRVSPTTAQHVLDDLAGFLDPATDAVLDGGACPIGVESTIVDLTVVAASGVALGSDRCGDDRGGARRAGRRRLRAESGERDARRPLRPGLRGGARRRCRCGGVGRRVGTRIGSARRTCSTAPATWCSPPGCCTPTCVPPTTNTSMSLIVVLPPASGLGHALRDRLVKAAAGSRRSPPSPAS